MALLSRVSGPEVFQHASNLPSSVLILLCELIWPFTNGFWQASDRIAGHTMQQLICASSSGINNALRLERRTIGWQPANCFFAGLLLAALPQVRTKPGGILVKKYYRYKNHLSAHVLFPNITNKPPCDPQLCVGQYQTPNGPQAPYLILVSGICQKSFGK